MIDLEVEYAPLSEDGGDALDRLGRCQRRPALLRAPGQTDDETPWACALDGPPVNGHPNLDDAGLGAASAAALQSPWVPSAFPAFTPQVEAPPGSDGGDGALPTAQAQAQAPFSYGSLYDEWITIVLPVEEGTKAQEVSLIVAPPGAGGGDDESSDLERTEIVGGVAETLKTGSFNAGAGVVKAGVKGRVANAKAGMKKFVKSLGGVKLPKKEEDLGDGGGGHSLLTLGISGKPNPLDEEPLWGRVYEGGGGRQCTEPAADEADGGAADAIGEATARDPCWRFGRDGAQRVVRVWLRKRPPSNPWPFLTVKEESRADAQDKAPQQYRAALLKRLSDEKTAPMRMDGSGGLLELLADIQRSHAELLDCAGCENCKDGDTGPDSPCATPLKAPLAKPLLEYFHAHVEARWTKLRTAAQTAEDPKTEAGRRGRK